MVTRDLDYLYHHVFLPPCVPQYDDQKIGAGDRALIDRLGQLAPLFRDLPDIDFLHTMVYYLPLTPDLRYFT